MSGFVFYRVLYNNVVRPVICQGLYFIGFFIIMLFALLYVRVYIFNLRDTEVVIYIIIVVLKRAKHLNHYLNIRYYTNLRNI
jgi:hypothetical protein